MKALRGRRRRGGGEKEETAREESDSPTSKSTEGEKQGKVEEVGKVFTIP